MPRNFSPFCVFYAHVIYHVQSFATAWTVLTTQAGKVQTAHDANKRCEFRIKLYLICIIRALNRCTTHITVDADSLSRPFNRIYFGVCALIDTDLSQLNFVAMSSIFHDIFY